MSRLLGGITGMTLLLSGLSGLHYLWSGLLMMLAYPARLCAAGDDLGTQPTTVLGTLILITVSSVGCLAWIVKRQYETIDLQNGRLEKIAVVLKGIEDELKLSADCRRTCKALQEQLHGEKEGGR